MIVLAQICRQIRGDRAFSYATLLACYKNFEFGHGISNRQFVLTNCQDFSTPQLICELAQGRTPLGVLNMFLVLTNIYRGHKSNQGILAVKKINSKIESDKHSLELICNWIDQHLDERIGWTELTQASGLSHMEIHTLFHIFKRTSPMQWIRTQREMAKEKANFSPGDDAIPMPSSLLSKDKKSETE